MSVSPTSPSSPVNVCPSSPSHSNDSEVVPSSRLTDESPFVGVSGRRHDARGRGLGRVIMGRECGVRERGEGGEDVWSWWWSSMFSGNFWYCIG